MYIIASEMKVNCSIKSRFRLVKYAQHENKLSPIKTVCVRFVDGLFDLWSRFVEFGSIDIVTSILGYYTARKKTQTANHFLFFRPLCRGVETVACLSFLRYNF